MRHVRQRYDSDCGIAGAACIAGTGYWKMHNKAIEVIWKNKRPSSYVTCSEDIKKLLKKFKVKVSDAVRVKKWSRIPDKALVRILYANGCGHLVIFTRDEKGRMQCYDPYLDKVRRDLHKMRPPTHYMEIL
jgi:hypothetical protein